MNGFADVKKWFREKHGIENVVVHSTIGEPLTYDVTYEDGTVVSHIDSLSKLLEGNYSTESTDSTDSTDYERGFNDCKKKVMDLLMEEGLEALAAHIETDLLPHEED